MKRVIIVLTLCLLTCACVSNKPSKEILEREKYTNTKQIVKENIYGCWNFDSLDVYREKRLIYDANEHSTINFSKDSLEYCYYNEKSKFMCINLNYEIEGNFLKIEKNDVLNEKYTMYMYENDKLLDFSLTTVYDDMDYLYHLSYSKDCKIN